jgi:CheY-like chemotaxis protein
LTVLVVDDDPLVLTNMGAMLADLGHKAFEASSAKEALDILRRESSIELVLTDHAMLDDGLPTDRANSEGLATYAGYSGHGIR